MALIPKTFKLYQETLDLFNRLMEESEYETADKWIAALLEHWQNPRKGVSKKEDLEKIQQLTDRITELETMINELSKEPITSVPADLTRIAELEQDLINAQTDLRNYQESHPETNPEPVQQDPHIIPLKLSEEELAELDNFSKLMLKQYPDNSELLQNKSDVLWLFAKWGRLTQRK
jgi:hypothetical protein